MQDVKSANVLLDAYLRAKLADLGLAKVCNQSSKLNESVTNLDKGITKNIKLLIQ